MKHCSRRAHRSSADRNLFMLSHGAEKVLSHCSLKSFCIPQVCWICVNAETDRSLGGTSTLSAEN